jgi:hypothetical protein
MLIASPLSVQAQAQNQPTLDNWRTWLKHYFPDSVQADFAAHHERFWEWVWQLKKGIRPQPYVLLLARGGGKSSSAELAAALCAMTARRHYVIYVCETQDQADKHVATIATLLESAGIQRAVNKYGNSKGWRRERLRTQDATIDALGLDTASRGIKVDDDRPDLMILDDIDGRHDSAKATQKKIETLTTTILPAGSNDCAVTFIQNLVHINSIASQLLDGRADFLNDRIVDGAHKAINNLKYEARDGKYVITQGEPTWTGQDRATCEGQINTWGLEAFLREAQHEVATVEGSVYGDVWSDGEPDGNVTEKAEYEPGNGEVLWALDDGYAGEWVANTGYYSAESHPRVILSCQMKSNGILCVFDESYAVKIESLQHINSVLESKPRPARAGLGQEMAELRGSLHKLGIYTLPGANSVDESVKVLRSWIAKDANGIRKVLVHPRCKILRKEPPMFSHIEGMTWEDKFGHGLAALRYLVWALRHNQ